MPQQAWSKKRERQYDHIKAGLKKRGESEDTAEEIAARTVNKERARPARPSRRAARPPRTSRRVAAAGSARTRARGRTKEQLYNEAKKKGIEGRSKMNKAQLAACRRCDRRLAGSPRFS